MRDGNNFETDSEAIFNHIDKEGIEDTWLKIFGSAALAFYDLEKQVLSLTSNGKRSLFFSPTEDKRALFWASEDWMLEAMSYRFRVPLEKIMPVGENELLHFVISDDKKVGSETRLLEYYKKYTPNNTYYNNLYKNKAAYETKEDEAWDNIDIRTKIIREVDFCKKYKNCSYCLETLVGEYETAVILDHIQAICGSCASSWEEFGYPLN